MCKTRGSEPTTTYIHILRTFSFSQLLNFIQSDRKYHDNINNDISILEKFKNTFTDEEKITARDIKKKEIFSKKSIFPRHYLNYGISAN